jgi:hypothetical protein
MSRPHELHHFKGRQRAQPSQELVDLVGMALQASKWRLSS